jgi:hypothetical protein
MVSVMYSYDDEKRLPVLEDYTRMLLLWIMHGMDKILCKSRINVKYFVYGVRQYHVLKYIVLHFPSVWTDNHMYPFHTHKNVMFQRKKDV